MSLFACAAERTTADTAEVLKRLLGKLQLWSRITRTTQQVRPARRGRVSRQDCSRSTGLKSGARNLFKAGSALQDCIKLMLCTLSGGHEQEAKEVLQKGSPRNVLVQLEDRAGGRKHITRLSGGPARVAHGPAPDRLRVGDSLAILQQIALDPTAVNLSGPLFRRRHGDVWNRPG